MSVALSQPSNSLEKIVSFIRETYRKQHREKAVIAVSGGIDSALALTLLSRALKTEQIYPLLLPYGDQETSDAESILEFNQIPQQNWQKIDIKPLVAVAAQAVKLLTEEQVRRGNLMARARMMLIFDRAKQLQALVCGTENKSEKHLGYFTRFGDEASDLEPIVHLYKTQVWQLAKYLKLPAKIIEKAPSAGLWPGQTDEAELGFSYELADQVIFQLVDQQRQPSEVEVSAASPDQIQAVINQVQRTVFKQQTPYLFEKK